MEGAGCGTRGFSYGKEEGWISEAGGGMGGDGLYGLSLSSLLCRSMLLVKEESRTREIVTDGK